MYLSLNFRFPTGSLDTMQRDPGLFQPHGSAFKQPHPSDDKSLPPISSLRPEGQFHPDPRLPPGYSSKGLNQPVVSSGGVVSAAQQAAHQNAVAMMNSLNPHHHVSALHHHHQPHQPLVGGGLGQVHSSTGLQPPVTSFPTASAHGTHPPHPAFALPFPSWLPTAATHPFNTAQLQHLMASDGGIMAQYLNSCDPLARAALMELSRMGHYPLGKKLFGCPQCRYITDRKNNLKRHVATMHQDCDKVLECCGVYFKNKASLRDHVMIFHSNGYMCRFCGRNFCRKALLKRHLTVHSGQKDFICDQCDYATSHKSNLERHRKVHDRQGEFSDDNSSDTSSHASPSGNSRMGLLGHYSSEQFHQLSPGLNKLYSTGSGKSPSSDVTDKRMTSFPVMAEQKVPRTDYTSAEKLISKSSQIGHEQSIKVTGSSTLSDDTRLSEIDEDFDINNINVVDVDV